MSDHLNEDTGISQVSEEDQLDMLKETAKQMGVKFSPKIGLEALQEKIREHQASEEEDDTEKLKGMSETARKALIRQKQRREQLALVRVRISNLNPSKADLAGEIFTVRTKYLGIVKKFIPYGEATDEGYHVPRILYNEMKSRKFLQVKTKQNKQTGQIDVSTRWVPEFAFEELPQLSKEELRKLANQQAAAAGMA